METIYAKYEKNSEGSFSPVYYAEKVSGWVSAYSVDNAVEALAWFNEYFGREIPGNFSWGATSEYQTEAGRQRLTAIINAVAVAPKTDAPAVSDQTDNSTEFAPVEMKKCSCGHTIPKHLVMSASLGSSCPDCYDKMSN